MSDLVNKRIVVRIDDWPRDSSYPLGYYIRQIGEIGTRETEMEVLLVENDIVSTPFTPHMVNSLPTHTYDHFVVT